MADTLVIPFSEILKNDVGASLRIVEVTQPYFGGSLTYNETAVTYTAPADNLTLERDQFGYTVVDTFGQRSNATVTIMIKTIGPIDAENDFFGPVPCGRTIIFTGNQIMANDSGKDIFISSVGTSQIGAEVTLLGNGSVSYQVPCPETVKLPDTPIDADPVKMKRMSDGSTYGSDPGRTLGLVYGGGNPFDPVVGDLMVLHCADTNDRGVHLQLEPGWTLLSQDGTNAMYYRWVDQSYLNGMSRPPYTGDFATAYPYYTNGEEYFGDLKVFCYALPEGMTRENFIVEGKADQINDTFFQYQHPNLTDRAYVYASFVVYGGNIVHTPIDGAYSTGRVFAVNLDDIYNAGTFPVQVTAENATGYVFSLILRQPTTGQVIPGGTYTPPMANSDSFAYTIRDANNQSASATVFVALLGPPLAFDDDLYYTLDDPSDTDSGMTIPAARLLVNDQVFQGSLISIGEPTAGARATLSADRSSVNYWHDPRAANESDRFAYRVQDRFGRTAEAHVNMTIPPLETGGGNRWPQTPASGSVSSNDNFEYFIETAQRNGAPRPNSGNPAPYVPKAGHVIVARYTTDSIGKGRRDVLVSNGWTMLADRSHPYLWTRIMYRILTDADVEAMYSNSIGLKLLSANDRLDYFPGEENPHGVNRLDYSVYDYGPLSPTNAVRSVYLDIADAFSYTITAPAFNNPSEWLSSTITYTNTFFETGQGPRMTTSDNSEMYYQFDGHRYVRSKGGTLIPRASTNPEAGVRISGQDSIMYYQINMYTQIVNG